MSRAEEANIEAANWLMTRENGPLTSDEQAALDAWLSASDGNKPAYWRLEFGWEQADRPVALGQGSVEQIEEAAPPRTLRWRRLSRRK